MEDTFTKEELQEAVLSLYTQQRDDPDAFLTVEETLADVVGASQALTDLYITIIKSNRIISKKVN